MSGRAAASIITAQPPWQLPTITGFWLFGWRSTTTRMNSASASVTSASVCPGIGSGKKMTKYTGCPARQRDADLGLLLEAADAGPVSGARIDDDERTLVVVDDDALRRDDPHQCVVRRALVGARVGDHFVVVLEHRRLAGRLVLQPLVAALAQRVPVQHRALRGVDRVLRPLPPELVRRFRRAPARELRRMGAARALDVALAGGTEPPLQEVGDRPGNLDRAVDRAVQVSHGVSNPECCNATF